MRAYSSATKAGLEASTIISKIWGSKLMVHTDYTGLGKIQYILGQRGLKILDSQYTDQVVLRVMIPETEVKKVQEELIEGTNGQVKMEVEDQCYFAEVDGDIKTF